MTQAAALDLLNTYYAAFNAEDKDGMIALVSDDVAHHVNEGQVRVGKDKFVEFSAHMTHCYKEFLTDVVIFANEDGTRGAAEFIVNGEYLRTDEGLPEANGQKYVLPGGAFFDIKDGKIARITTYYNLADWTAQVVG